MSSYEWAVAEMRSIARRLGIVPYLSRLRGFVHGLLGIGHYEARFELALMAHVRPGDVVWDIGANVGLYTVRLSEAVGEKGRVIAFEPSPHCFVGLQRSIAGCANVGLIQSALSDKAGEASLSINSDHTTGSLFTGAATNFVKVPVEVGDALVAEGKVPAPNVLKIDVEGFEEEVLRGLSVTLHSQQCRAVFCEVHFGILDARGQRQAPGRITQLLQQCGFVTHWVDASHLAAIRV